MGQGHYGTGETKDGNGGEWVLCRDKGIWGQGGREDMGIKESETFWVDERLS